MEQYEKNLAVEATRGHGSEKASSRVTSSSRESLYRHFDQLTKEEQMMVLQDALHRKERLEKLEKETERFSQGDLKGLSSKEKAERLVLELNKERERRIQKETAFIELLNEERNARKQVCLRATDSCPNFETPFRCENL